MNRNKLNMLNQISDCLLTLKNNEDIINFMLEIFTESELEILSKRWQILEMLSNNMTQRDIAKKLKVSLCKVTRGAKLLKNNNSIISKYLVKEE